MTSGNNDSSDNESRTVPRTLGIAIVAVILVVAAGAVGVFVLDIGGGDSGPPETTFEASEEMKTWGDEGKFYYASAPQITMTAASGEALSVTNTRITIDGRPNVWGLQDGEVTQPNKWKVAVQPEPNICRVLGSEESVTWDSGQSQHVMIATSRSFDGNLQQYSDFPIAPAHSELDSITADNAFFLEGSSGPINGCDKYTAMQTKGKAFRLDFQESEDGNRTAIGSFTHIATKGSTVAVRWRAASGGETQTLSTYEVQQAPEKPSLE